MANIRRHELTWKMLPGSGRRRKQLTGNRHMERRQDLRPGDQSGSTALRPAQSMGSLKRKPGRELGVGTWWFAVQPRKPTSLSARSHRHAIPSGGRSCAPMRGRARQSASVLSHCIGGNSLKTPSLRPSLCASLQDPGGVGARVHGGVKT